MNNPCHKLCPECIKVEHSLNIDLEHLFRDLGKFTARCPPQLTEQEKFDLCLCLTGDEPIAVAKKLYSDHSRCLYEQNTKLTKEQIDKLVEEDMKKKAGHIRKRISETIGSYIMDLILEKDPELGNSLTQRPCWTKIIFFLIDNGYRIIRKDLDLTGERQIAIISYNEKSINPANLVKLLNLLGEICGEGSLVLKKLYEEGDKNES